MSKLSIEQRAAKWALGDDTGSSSITIARHMLGMPHEGSFAVSEPSDGHDLGRCCRLLLLVPEWKPRIPELAALSNAWAALVPHWAELTELLARETGPEFGRDQNSPATCKRIKEITAEARKADGWVEIGKLASIRMGKP